MQKTVDRNMRRFLWQGVLALVGLSLAVIVFAAVIGTGQSAGTIISTFSTRFLGIIIEALPFLLLGAVISGVIDAFLTPDDIARVVPRNPFLATIVGALMGFAFPVCECGVVPVVRRLFKKGLPTWVGITFLLAAPVMNPIVLVSTYVAFGFGPVLIGRVVFTLLVSIGVGMIFSLGARPQEVLRPNALLPVMGGDGEGKQNPHPPTPSPLHGEGEKKALPGINSLIQGEKGRAATFEKEFVILPPKHSVIQRKPLLAGLGEALQSANNEFFEMGRYLIIGSLLAATMQTLISQDVLLALGKGPVISVLVMQAMAFVLSVCSTVDAFLALAFVGTFTTGSIISFLTFGPMVDIKSTLMFLGVFQKRTVLYLILLPMLMTLLIGVWLNLNVAF
jgi:uncharacterized protein